MQKGNLLLFVASLGIVWEHASSTSAGYCCPQITVALGTEDDGTYNFLAEGKGPAMKECQDACIYSKDFNQTDLYCFEAVTSDDLGNGQVQCEAISPYSLLTSTTPAVTGPTAEELLKKIEDLQKDFETQAQAQIKQTEALKKEFDVELKKEVEAREAEDSKIKTEINSFDGRLRKTEKRDAVCGYKSQVDGISSATTLIFDRVYDEVDSSSGGKLETNGNYTAGVEGVYYVTLELGVSINDGESLRAELKLSSGNYAGDNDFMLSWNGAGGRIHEQASASRYVTMSAGETLHISFEPKGGDVYVYAITMCVSLYSASG